MRKSYIYLLIIFFVIGYVRIMIAQENKLDQSKLLEQFVGTWVGDFTDGTKITCVNEKFSDGILSKSEIKKENKVLDSIVQIYGYDASVDKIIIAELKASTKQIELCSLEFLSKNSGEIMITNPKDASFSFEFFLKSENELIQKAIQNGKVVNEIILKRKS